VLVRLSRQTRLVINQNFLLGVLFVIGGLVLAAMKIVSPILAAVMHVTGSLLVVFNSARLVRHGEELEPYLGSPQAEPTTPATPSAPPPAPSRPRQAPATGSGHVPTPA
jgi:Cd2+/Zn2+-exporting ATPase